MGGLRKQLILQFMGENLFLCFLGFLAALLIAEWLVPAYDTLWPWLELDYTYANHAGLLFVLLGLLCFTALVAGGYPAVYVTSFEPVSILKGTSRLRGTSWLTRILLAFQFTISLVTIVFAVGFYNNAKYQSAYDLGFSTTGVISVWLDGESTFNTYRNSIEGHDDILKIGGTKHHVVNWHYDGSVRYGSLEKQVDIMDVGENYIETVNIQILSGRSFTKDSQTDRAESVIVTQEFVKQFGWTDDPIGKRLVWRDSISLYVIGVARDIHVRSLFQPVQPLMIRYTGPETYTQMVVQVPADKMVATNAFMEKQWKDIFPNELYNFLYIDYSLQRTNETNDAAIIIFSFLGFFAALMSATGLFTLVSLNILKRIKEIGIRKVLGASVANVVGVISFEFVLILLCASILGGAIGFVLVDKTMRSAWVYYERVGLVTLSTSVAIIIVLSVLTVGMKTVRAARMNPVKNLRME
jgi:ABC-type antimicrobial peptide transport system permease subunit